MSAGDDGGPAFPTSDANYATRYAAEGMYLRDYFAAKAMPIAYKYWMEDYYHPDAPDAVLRADDQRNDFDEDTMGLIAEDAYALADAMLKARKS